MSYEDMINPVLNVPSNTWYQDRNHNRIPKKASSKKWLDAYYANQGTDQVGPPVNVALPAASGLPNVGQPLSCSTGTWGGAAPIAYAYQWTRNNIAISVATNQTYLVTASDLGTTIRCEVTATNLDGTATETSNAIGPIEPALEAPYNGVAPSVTGTAIAFETLTCNGGTWGGYPIPTYTRQWKRGSSLILGATGTTYILTNEDVGFNIKCTVTATNSQGTLSVDSNAVGPVAEFSAAWQQFDGSAWLYKATDLTGIPTNSAGFILAVTYSPSAADIASGASRNLLTPITATNRLVLISKSSANGLTANAETSSDTVLWSCSGGAGLVVAGGHYLILFSGAPSGVGGKSRMIDLATGTVIISVDDVDTGTLGGPSAAGWVVAASNGAGSGAHSGAMDRAMLWANTYADAGDPAVQALFHVGGVLQNPKKATNAIGTLHVSVVGADLQTGVNAGSGGNFTKTGTGSITPVP